MDEVSKKLIDDCFLRPIPDARAANIMAEPIRTKPLKTELQVLRLSDDSQKMVMDTLRSIHGPEFRFDEATKYKDRGNHLKKSYWENRGTLMVQSISSYSNVQKPGDEPEDRLRRYAILKLESYGFASSHCNEAFDNCDGDIDLSLELLFSKYMKIPIKNSEDCQTTKTFIESELIENREDEKMALESIYDKQFEEKDHNRIWSLKFKIDHLLSHSPSEKKKQITADLEKLKKLQIKQKEPCRNFSKSGQCKYSTRCRFSHIVLENIDEKQKTLGTEDNNSFYLEIRFPKNTIYPYEPPMIFLKTTCHDIPKIILLKISRKLYNESKSLTNDGMPCVYTISEILQNDEEINKYLILDNESFINPEHSLFHIDNESLNVESIKNDIDLPTHYKMGSTGQNERSKLSSQQIIRDDQHLVKKFLEKQTNQNYKNMLKQRQKLPAWSKMIEILDLINKNQVVIISGETGCGKSTQIPQFILDNWLFESSNLENKIALKHVEIICTQPRRISAIGVSERVAEERNEKIGNSIGYQIRLENKMSSLTRLTFCTTGLLLRRLQTEPLLDTVSHIIVDEVHERSEESDFLLLILKEILGTRKDLRVILMSATLNANLFSKYFGNNIPILEIPGRTYPVQQLFLEDILERSGFILEPDSQYCRKIKMKDEEFLNELVYDDVKAVNTIPTKNIKDENLNLSALYARYPDFSKSTCKSLYLMDPMKINPELIEGVLKYIIEGDHNWPQEGSILIFLPGISEIQLVHDSLCESKMFNPRTGAFILVPLHSTLSSEEQSLVFRRAPNRKRKIVLSTNIAETSVTIDDCVFVIDCGLMKEKRFDANKNMESLDLVWVSRANAMQRKGRAGRVMPGIAIHLFTGHRFANNILSQPVPEIHRVPLEQLLLRVKTLTNFENSNLMEVISKIIEPPSNENIISAINRLQDVGAIDEEQNLTSLGHHLSALPVDVRIGKLMLFGAIFQCLDSVLTIAACLSHKSPFVSPFNKRHEAERKKRDFAIFNSDHLTILMAYKKWNLVSKRSKYSGRCFADENFLSWKTLDTIVEIKHQFLSLLISIGFVPIDLPQKKRNLSDNIFELTGHELNSNGENNRLLISILCAALYPNIVKVLTPEKSYTLTAGGAMPKTAQPSDLRFKTREDGYVALHPSSVNSVCGTFLSPFLIYQEKVKTSRIFIRECSMIPLIPLVFFAGNDLKIELHSGDFVILLENGWIMLKAHTHEIAEMIQCLRQELLKLLEIKICDPCLNLLNHANGKKIISTIVFLISRE